MTARTELERLRAMFEQAPGMLVMVSGPEHVYELANAAYRKFLGRSDLIGRRVIDAVPELEEQGLSLSLIRCTGPESPSSVVK
jgi:PAS domain-containing protein